MQLDWMFFFNSVLLGVGLAMDEFSVSLANGLNEPRMRPAKLCGVAGVFAAFQAVMPLAGWAFVHTALGLFNKFQHFIPWIALLLLCFIGGKMFIEGIRGNCENSQTAVLGISSLLVQGVATSIDALSVGFTIAHYDLKSALVCAVIIGAVAFVICSAGLLIGRRFGTRLSGCASIIGGVILIAIGIEIFISNII